MLLGRGMAWLDTGTPKGLLKASEYVETIQSMQGMYVSCIEEIAWRKGFISTGQLKKLGEELKMTDYGRYLIYLLLMRATSTTFPTLKTTRAMSLSRRISETEKR